MNAVVQHNPDSLPAETGEGATTMLSVISRAASDPSVDIEKLERLMAMKERMDAKTAAREELWTERDSGHWTDPAKDE